MNAHIQVRQEQLRKYMQMAGLKRQKSLADAAGLTETGIYRILEGRSLPANKTIAGLLAAFPALSFDDLFEVIVDPDTP